MGLVDYEKLKIQHTELTQTTRARDKELPLLRLEAGRANQVQLGSWLGLLRVEASASRTQSSSSQSRCSTGAAPPVPGG